MNPAVGEAGLLGWEAYHQKRTPRKLLQSWLSARLSLKPPYPPVEPLMRRRAWAEALTDRIAGEAYQVLDPAERQELVELMETASRMLQDTPVAVS